MNNQSPETDKLARLIAEHAPHGFAGVMRARSNGCSVYLAAVALDDVLRQARCGAPNPYLPEAPADGEHIFPNDGYRCCRCGVYNRAQAENQPFYEPCEGGWAQSEKMRAAAEERWAAELTTSPAWCDCGLRPEHLHDEDGVPYDPRVSSPPGQGEHGPVAATWFGRGQWPTCRCGYAPRDNTLLNAHWAEHGFTVVDDHGQLKCTPIPPTSGAAST